MGCGSSSQAKVDGDAKAPEKKQEDTKVETEVNKVEPENPTSESSEPKESPKSTEESNESNQSEPVKDEMREEVVLETKIVAPVKFEEQMGGHAGTFHKLDEKKIMKHGGEAETLFYSEIHLYPKLQEFAPAFHGFHELDGKKYIVIEDATAGFSKPCILDIKIGKQSFGEDADESKKANMAAKDAKSTTGTLGARITAVKVYQVETGDYIKKSKDYGKTIKTEDFQSAFAEYFHNGKGLRKSLIPKFLEKIRVVKEWVESQGDLRMYSSSILFVYDGDESNDNVEIKLIDFAHVFKIADGGKDDGYIFGINNVVQYLEAIHAQE